MHYTYVRFSNLIGVDERFLSFLMWQHHSNFMLLLVLQLSFNLLTGQVSRNLRLFSVCLCYKITPFFPVLTSSFLPQIDLLIHNGKNIRYPLKAVKVMHTVALRMESSLPINSTTPNPLIVHQVRIIFSDV